MEQKSDLYLILRIMEQKNYLYLILQEEAINILRKKLGTSETTGFLLVGIFFKNSC